MEVFLARQPIFDLNKNVIGYEILYRDGLINRFDSEDGDKASKEVIFNTFQTFGIDNLTDGKPVFINFTEELINEEIATLFPKDFLVVEILEDVLPSDEVMENSRFLKKMGYRIALDDFIYSPEYEKLIELADIIKIDFLASNREQIRRICHGLKDQDIELLAEKVETREDFEFALDLGFSLFQGYFFSEPEIVASKKLQPIKATYLQLLNEVNKMDIDFDNISELISMDLALTYNLLKLVNSTAFGFKYGIRSVKHAVVALGEREIRKWTYLIVVSIMGQDEPEELIRLSLIRGRFMEMISMNTRYDRHAGDLFLIGLFSLLEAILRRPIADILDELKAPDMVRDTLIYGEGQAGNIYKMALAYERGNWDEVLKYSEDLDIDPIDVPNGYITALMWYRDLVG
ncbi:MAG: HDOD domain-containing protein [Tissierellia bacterium]|nr:HDOD domain-containing protein [Tissierellia bacterium]